MKQLSTAPYARKDRSLEAVRNADPQSLIQINAEDAEESSMNEGEVLDVRSRRGAVRLSARLAAISCGQVFTPFHFGSIDSQGQSAGAVNELTKFVICECMLP